MNRRLASSAFAALLVGAGVLYAQTEDLKAYLDRGRALSKAEKYEQALPYLLFALELGEKEFGTDSPAVVPLLNDLAELYATRRDYRDAEPLFERSLAIQDQELTRYHAGIARTLNNLGSLYEATERPAEARKLYERVVVALEPALGTDDPSVRTARLRLAKLTEEALPAPVAEPAVAPPPVAPPAFRVHLTSIRNPDDSGREWLRLRRIYPKRLQGLEVAVTRVDQGPERGVWYRIQGGPLAEPDARALCASFSKLGVWCAVMRGPVPKAPVPPPVVTVTGEEVPSPAPPPTAGFRIHLTSIRNPDAADAEWARLRRLFRKLLEDLSLTVARADLGPKRGVWYRIQGGPLSKTEARGRCASFAELTVWCQVVPPPGNAANGTQRQVALRVRRRDPAGARVTRRPRETLPGRRPEATTCAAAPEPGARRFADRP